MRDMIIPQGRYKIGRDISEGIYLFAALNDLSLITIERDKDFVNSEFTLSCETTPICHFEIKSGEIMIINGKVMVHQLSNPDRNKQYNLEEEIYNFEVSLGWIDPYEKDEEYCIGCCQSFEMTDEQERKFIESIIRLSKYRKITKRRWIIRKIKRFFRL